MDIDALTDADRKALAKDLAAELDTGLYGNRAVLSRRQLLSLAGGSAGVAALTALGVDPAAAQSAAGQVGTEASPENVFAYDLDVQGALQRDLDAGGQAIRNAGSVSTSDLGITDAGTILQSNQGLPAGGGGATENPSDTTSNSYETVANATGAVKQYDLPPGATLYGLYFAFIGNDTPGETTFSRPALVDTSGSTAALSELEISISGDNSATVSSGWQEITSYTESNPVSTIRYLESRVTGGTGLLTQEVNGVCFEWRIE